MNSKRYQTGITAQAGSMGCFADTRESFLIALSYPVDCIEAHVQISESGDFYLGIEPLPAKEQKTAMPAADLFRQVAARPAVNLLLDIRDPRLTADSGVCCRHLEMMVREAGLIGRVYLKGIRPHGLAILRSFAPELPFLLNLIPSIGQEHVPAFCDTLIRRIRDSGAIGLHTHHRFVTRMLRHRLAENGLLLSVWDVNRERDMRRMLAMGADNIVTARLSTLLELRSRTTPAARPHQQGQPVRQSGR